MLYRWDATSRALTATAVLPDSGWVHAEAPTAAELDTLEAAGVPRAFMDHALDRNEVPRVDARPSGTLWVIRVPVRGESDDVPFHTSTLGVVQHGPRLVTLSCDAVDLPAEAARQDDFEFTSANQFVLRLVEAAAEHYLKHLHDIERAVDLLEDELQASLRNREVLALLKHQKALVHFTIGLEANALMLARLEQDPRFAVSAEDRALLADVRVEMQQALQMTRIAEEILSQMMDAFASIISNNLNVVMKVLTALTIVLTFPTMVASFYGMNVGLPLQHHPLAFVMAVAASFALSAAVAAYFWRKRWL